MLMRGQIQLRGLIRWKIRRARTRARYGANAMDQLPIVFGNAMPKNGSKLLFNIMRGLPRLGPFVDTGLNAIKPFFRNQPTSLRWIRGQLDMLRPGDVRLGYLYALEENVASLCRPGWANFQILRDPRDAMVSEIFYALDMHPQHLLHDYLASLDSMEARIDALIFGIPKGELKRVNVREHIELFLRWLDYEEIFPIHFEDLIAEPRAGLGRILDYLGSMGFEPELSRDQALDILQNQMAPERSDTFRQGKSGGWRNHFSDANKDHFKQVAGDLLMIMGYETTNDW